MQKEQMYSHSFGSELQRVERGISLVGGVGGMSVIRTKWATNQQSPLDRHEEWQGRHGDNTTELLM